MDRLRVRTEEVTGVPVARLDGQVDKLAVEQARAQLDPLAVSGKLVIALDNVTFIDSAGLHALFGLGHAAAASGGRVALSVPPGSPVARVVEIVRLGDAMPVRESVEDAALELAEVSAFDAGG
jgi:anti-anti-sigma factor